LKNLPPPWALAANFSQFKHWLKLSGAQLPDPFAPSSQKPSAPLRLLLGQSGAEKRL